MDFQERSELTRRILLGKFFSFVRVGDKRIKFEFQDPPQSILLQGDFIYQDALKSAKSMGMYSVKEAEAILISEGKWSVEKENQLSTIKDDIQKMQRQLSGLKYHKTNFRRVSEMIKVAKTRLNDLLTAKSEYDSLTAEYFAVTKKRSFIITKIAKPVDLQDDFKFSDKIIKILDVCYYRDNDVSSPQIRELARTEPWRVYWCSAKNTGSDLFTRPLAEITDLQYALLHWSRVYDYAFECMNPPSDEVVENDDAFDAWYQQEADRIKREKGGGNSGAGPINSSGVTERYIIADDEGAKDVYALNDPVTRNKIKKRQEVIKEKGEVKEADLPDVQKELRMQANRLAVQKVTQKGS